MSKLTEILRGNRGAILAVVVVLGAGYAIWNTTAGSNAATELNDDLSHRTFIDETGATFVVSTASGSVTVNPATNKQGYPVEMCWWTKDGKVRPDKPFPVLLNDYIHKSGPTFCPDCGRLVVAHNPSPMTPDAPQVPPPTQQEYERRRGR